MQNVQLQVEMDLLKAKAQRISQQRRVLARNLMKGEEQLQGGGGEWSATWAEQWRAKLQQLPEFQNTDEEEIREVRQLTSTTLVMLVRLLLTPSREVLGPNLLACLVAGTVQRCVLALELEEAAG